ncbi:MAG: type I-G CRISPR-associated protein Cas8g1/Csx17, partial [Gaiellaceae bacterium]
DTTYVLTQEARAFPPLLGTGGNEGSGSYVSGFAQLVVETIIDGKWSNAMSAALFGEGGPDVRSDQTAGHFAPWVSGGANPWQYMLALEGSCLWASGVARRLGAGSAGVAAFPFMTSPTPVGHGSLCAADGRKPKAAKRDVAEIWLPLWKRFTSVKEVQQLLAEGRVTVRRRRATTGLDFARAAATLGVDRGISSFERFAFLQRNGQSFFATPLGAFDVTERTEVNLLGELDDWLDRLHRACRGTAPPPRFLSALRRIDATVFELCQRGGRGRMTQVLCALGNVEHELSNAERFRKTEKRTIHPVPILSPMWINACDDGTREFRLALALASVRSDGNGSVGDLRVNLEAVERKARQWEWAERSRAVVWSAADLRRNLSAVLARRVMDAGHTGTAGLP